MIGKMKDIGTVVVLLLVIMALMYLAASCAPAQTQLSGPNTTAYIGEHFDADRNFICYHTFTPPIQMQCFDLNRR